MRGWNTQSRFSVYKVPDGFLNTSAAKRRLLLWTTTHTLLFLSLCPTLWDTAQLMFGLKAERQKMLCELWEQKQFSPWGRRSNTGVCHSYSFIFALVVWCAYIWLDIFCILWKKVTQSTYLKYIYFILSMVKIYSYIYWHIAGNLLI